MIWFNSYTIQNKDLYLSQSHRHRGKRTKTKQKIIGITWLKYQRSWGWIQSQNPVAITKEEKQKVTAEDVWKEALETLAEPKKR